MSAPGPETPKVSVVIKSYNHAKYIGQAIESVLAQSFQDFEIIVTDDGSTDGTPDAVRAFSDPRIKLEVLPQNIGLSGAMNAALSRATGDYVAILNSDDFALPDRLSRQVAQLDANPAAGAVFSRALAVDEEGEPIVGYADFDVPLSFPDHRRGSWLRYFFFNCNCLCAPSAMVRREAFTQIGPYDPRLTNLQDLDVWVRLARAWDIDFLPTPLTAFRVRAGGANLSAPRIDTMLRSPFEYALILRRYLDIDLDFFHEIFAEDLGQRRLENDRDKQRWLAEAAIWKDSPAHRLFGLETYFDLADGQDHYRHLRHMTGEIDLFGLKPNPTLAPALPAVDRLCLITDATIILPERIGDKARFLVPGSTREAYLASPQFRREGDARNLGVVVTGIAIDEGGGFLRPVNLADAAFGQGFYVLERKAGGQWRWTDGYGRIPDALLPQMNGYYIIEVTGDFDPSA